MLVSFVVFSLTNSRFRAFGVAKKPHAFVLFASQFLHWKKSPRVLRSSVLYALGRAPANEVDLSMLRG